MTTIETRKVNVIMAVIMRLVHNNLLLLHTYAMRKANELVSAKKEEFQAKLLEAKSEDERDLYTTKIQDLKKLDIQLQDLDIKVRAAFTPPAKQLTQ